MGEIGENIRRQRKRRRRRMAVAWRVAVAACFVVLLAGLLLFTVVGKSRAFSQVENRALAGRPSLSKETLRDGTFFVGADAYLSDQFVVRDGWIGLQYFANRLAGRRENGGVYTGKGGQLFADPVTPDETAVLESRNAINAFAAAHPSLPQYLMLVPGAAAVQADRLPSGAPVRDQIADVRAFTGALDPNIQVIDAGVALQESAGEEIFYRTDHHWTSLGAYRVFQAATADLGIDTPYSYEPLLVANNFHGTLASKSGNTAANDDIYIYRPTGTDLEYYVNYPDSRTRAATMFQVEQLEEKDQYKVFFGGNYAVVEIHTTANNGRNLLVIKDSFANSFMQFLPPYYETIVMVDPRYCYEDMETLLSRYDINEMLYLYSADIFFEDTDLADLLTS